MILLNESKIFELSDGQYQPKHWKEKKTLTETNEYKIYKSQ